MLAKVTFYVYAGLYNEYLNHLIDSGFLIEKIIYDQFGFTATCIAADYKLIASASRKYQCRVRVKSKKGRYFIVGKIVRRKGILAGIIAFIILSYIFSMMVWKIDINIQNEQIRNRVAALLFDNKIYTGVFYNKEYFENVCKIIVQSDDDIAYINLNFYKGTLKCEVSMRKNKEDYIDNRRDENLYSSLNGLITDVRVYDGFSSVQPGQSVSAGDLLVSAETVDKFGKISLSPVRAYIEGLCTKEYSIFIPFYKESYIFTGKSDYDKYIYFMGKEYHVYESELKNTDDYISVSKLSYLNIMGFSIPITLKTVTYYHREKVTIENDVISAQYAAKTQLQHMIDNDSKLKELLTSTFDYTLEDDGITAVCKVYGYYEMT